MDSDVWIFLLTVAIVWALIAELRIHRRRSKFENAWNNCLSKFLLTFSDGSAKCLEVTDGILASTTPPILKTHFNQEYWIISLHLEEVTKPQALPDKLYLYVEGLGKITLRKDRANGRHVMYRAPVITPQSLHYVSRRAVIGV